MTSNERTYPRTLHQGDIEVDLSVMSANDKGDVLDFARALPRHDLLFMRRDIQEPAAIDAWLEDIRGGYVTTLLARIDDEIVGYATLHQSELRWSSHVGELRVVLAPEHRGHGLGRLLTQEVFSLALSRGIEKMMARMTLDQKGAIATFEGLGFRPEALMRDHVKDLDGNRHDLVVLSHQVAEFHSTLSAYGVPESLGAD